MRKICVAGLKIQITCADDAYFARRWKAYESDFIGEPDLELETVIVDAIPIPECKREKKTGSLFSCETSDGRLCKYLLSEQSKQPFFCMYHTPRFEKVKLYFRKNAYIRGFTHTDMEYAYTGYIFAGRLLYLGGAVLHGSCIAYRGKGVIFSADSGVGKSTHVSLWKKRFGDECVIVNDDKPALLPAGSGFTVYGTPWSGKTELNQNLSFPLHAIVFIERGVDNAIEPVSKKQAAFLLMRQLTEFFHEYESGIRAVQMMNRLVESGLPMYRLRCNISDAAVDIVYRKLFEDGGKL